MKYKLQKYTGLNSRFDCPNCNGKKRFTKYIDTETNNYIADNVGRCNRVDKCGYHYKPKQFFENNNGLHIYYKPQLNYKAPPPKQIFTMPFDVIPKTLSHYENNHFAYILYKLFGRSDAENLIATYAIGTSKKWDGATIFWQLDANNTVRTGKIMLYNWQTNKRIKDHFSWVHTNIINAKTHELKQCFFGEHLVNKDKSKTIAIVESEKTAVICSHFMPQYIWLGAGNINGLSIEKFKVLKGRKVILYPDLNKGFEVWQQKAKELMPLAEVSVSNYLERIATHEQKTNGLDIADYLIETRLKNVA